MATSEVRVIACIRDAHGARVVTDRPPPVLEPGWAIVRPTLMGVSSVDVGVVRAGVFTGVLGHECVGVIERVGEGCPERLRPGVRVAIAPNIRCAACDLCRGGLGSHCRNRRAIGVHGADGCLAEHLSVPAACLVDVPDGIDDTHAAMLWPLAVALHASRVVRIEGKPYVTVLGDGPIGLLCAQLMTQANASVRLLGRHAERFGVCEKWGIRHRHIDDVGLRQDQDIVVDCTGDTSGLAAAVLMTRPRGRIVTKCAPTPAPMTPDTARGPTDDARAHPHRVIDSIVNNELELIGARDGTMRDALAVMQSGGVDVVSLVSRRFGLRDAVGALRAVTDRTNVKVLVEAGR